MPTVTACSHCRAKYTVPESAVGKRATCAKCKQSFVVAADGVAKAAVPAPGIAPDGRKAKTQAGMTPDGANRPVVKGVAAGLTEAELMAAFTAPMERSRLPIAYRLSTLLVAMVMVLLPLIYVGLIAAIWYGVYYHAVNHTGLMSVGTGRARAFMGIVYLAPLFIGPVVSLFMVKPLFARPARRERSRSLTRESEPLLFAFVDRVCETVRAAKPTRIDVDCDVNASAGFRRGVWSMLGNDLVLTIGLPLVGGLTVREFGGVLAHEFGHFAQGAGMRLTYLVRSIAHWFLRVVYQRDAWDEWLASAGNELDIRIGWVVALAQLGVAIGRGVLWVLMHVGFLVGGFLLRQMEFDADRFESRFAGSDAFASTMRKLQLLGAASQLAQAQASEHLDERRLVEDFPGLVLLNARTIPQETVTAMQKGVAESRTGWFDSHPCDRDRLAAAEALASPGIFRLERPAIELLANFAAQSKATTWDMYLAMFGPKVPRDALVPVPEFARAAKSRWRDANEPKQSPHYAY